ncbi:MAG: alcohol dehydrogenase catalytic domain-containing protein [Ilumatobacteraceae bacterium]
MITCDAAVVRVLGAPMSIERIRVDPPRSGEVMIEMGVAGICGSDRYVIEGHHALEPPSVCGHEGAGTVVEVGPDVTSIAVGDVVVQTFVGPCGECRTCRRGLRTFCPTAMHPSGLMRDGTHRMFDAGDHPVGNYLGLGSFSRFTVSPARHCVVIPPDVPMEIAAIVSCGVSTGVGAAVNVARIRPGDDVLVIGLGGVGAAAVMGAVLAGASRIIVSEVNPAKLELAKVFGATDVIDATSDDVRERVMEFTSGFGVDAVLLAPDRVRPEHYTTGVSCLGPAGIMVHVGGTAAGMDYIPVAPGALVGQQKSIVGTVIGGSDPARDVLRWIDLYSAGRLPLDRLITARYRLDEINRGFDDLIGGRNIRGVVDMRS